jgi:hypothetical protein
MKYADTSTIAKSGRESIMSSNGFSRNPYDFCTHSPEKLQTYGLVIL